MATNSPPTLISAAKDPKDPKQYTGKGVETGNIFDDFNNLPSEAVSPQEIPGLDAVKKYLYRLGYIKRPPPPYTNYTDGPFTSALKRYQRAFNLSVTGWIDDDTLYQMSLLRCIVPDIVHDERKNGNLSWPHGVAWLQGKKNLTYGFKRRSLPNVTAVFTDAFSRWSEATGMNFTETTYDDADIKIGFFDFDPRWNMGVGDSFINSAGNGSFGRIRLDDWWYWVPPNKNSDIDWKNGVLDLGSAAMHQIGHLLGLGHSVVQEAVMYPYILPSNETKLKLAQDDIKQFQNLHSSTAGDRGRYTVTAVLSSFLVAVVCMVLLD